MAPQPDRPARAGGDGVHHSGHILELRFDGVGGGIAARAKAPAVHHEGGHTGPKLRHERVEHGVVA
jgi:hypothetical protein